MDLKFFRGDDNSITLNFKQAGVAVNITGWTIFFTVKTKIEDTDDNAVLKKDVTSHTDAVNGITTVTWTDEDCDDLAGVYHYDIQYKDGSGLVKTVMKGRITFEEDVTRRIS